MAGVGGAPTVAGGMPNRVRSDARERSDDTIRIAGPRSFVRSLSVSLRPAPVGGGGPEAIGI
jgi:hypothetical protein